MTCGGSISVVGMASSPVHWCLALGNNRRWRCLAFAFANGCFSLANWRSDRRGRRSRHIGRKCLSRPYDSQARRGRSPPDCPSRSAPRSSRQRRLNSFHRSPLRNQLNISLRFSTSALVPKSHNAQQFALRRRHIAFVTAPAFFFLVFCLAAPLATGSIAAGTWRCRHSPGNARGLYPLARGCRFDRRAGWHPR